MFLWHFPWGRPHWVLPSVLPYGARTFLSCRRQDPEDSRGASAEAVARPAPTRHPTTSLVWHQ